MNLVGKKFKRSAMMKEGALQEQGEVGTGPEADLTMEIDGEGVEEDSLEKENLGVEPPAKKLKKDLIKEAEEKLKSCEEIVKSTTVPVTEKFTEVSVYTAWLIENNVNILQFESDFAEWSKAMLLLLLEEMTETSVEFFEFLCSLLKIAPTIFESVCEKVLGLVYTKHDSSSKCNLAYEVFMMKLGCTFERLRRFPKLIAKLLCSVRDNIDKLTPPISSGRKGQVSRKKDRTRNNFQGLSESTEFILPGQFMESYCSIACLLPLGQIIDLWKTLQYNLEEECIKKFSSASEMPSVLCLMHVVVELIAAFMCNVKVADYSVPVSTVEKVTEMMMKLKSNSLVRIGEELSTNYNTDLVVTFLKLVWAWGNLNQILSVYNENYHHEVPDIPQGDIIAEDLSVVFPFMSGEAWGALWKNIEKEDSTNNMRLMVSLLAMKLKCLALTDRQRRGTEEASLQDVLGPPIQENSLRTSLEATAKVIWNYQHLLRKEDNFIRRDEDVLDIALSYIGHDDLIKYAKEFVKNVLQSSSTIGINLQVQQQSSVIFHIAVIMESLEEGLKRVAKMHIMKQTIKKFLHDCLNSSSKHHVLNDINTLDKATSDELKSCITQAVEIVNDMVVEELGKEGNTVADQEHSPDLMRNVVKYIVAQELGQFPKTVKSLLFLSGTVLFSAILGYEEYNDIIEDLVYLLCECGGQLQGNELLFHIKWQELFELISSKSESLSSDSRRKLCSVLLGNIYISPKVATGFGETQLKSISTNFELTTSDGDLSLAVLDHITQEALRPKTKSTPLLINHTNTLASIAVKKLSDGEVITELHGLIQGFKKQKKKGRTVAKENDVCNSFASRVLHTCYLLLKGKACLRTDVVQEFNVIVLPYLHFALDFFEVLESGGYEKTKSDDNKAEMTSPLFNCRRFLIESLKSFEEYRSKLPADFLLRVIVCILKSQTNERDEVEEISEKASLKTIFKIANEDEFRLICDSLSQRMEDEKELIQVAQILGNLIDSEIALDSNKQIRRTTIEQCLFKYMEHIHSWKQCENVVNVATPYIQFQTALLRRRKPMGNLSSLAVCLSSITTFPFGKIEDISEFKRIYSSICELLNAMTVHRLDVLSFRTHIFLQCFQVLVESLVKRADQGNKLSDTEIYDLRSCGHCIERVCQSAKLGKHEFARVSPYLIVVLLKQFEKITVYPVVKTPLLNGCYKLLDICDDNGISHVNSMLSAGSREIFKSIYDLYKRFYRYKGKV